MRWAPKIASYRVSLALSMLVVCGFAAPAAVLAQSSQLTGDWWGARSTLAANGVTVLADNTSFFFGNTAGGVREDFDFGGHGDYVIQFDGARMGLPEGLFVKLRGEHRFGESLTGDVGSFMAPALLADLPVPDSEQVYLTNVLFTQALSESFAVYAGKFDTLDGDANAFAHGRGKTQFSNLAFVFNPVTAATVPYSTLGAGFAILNEGVPLFSFNVLNSTDTTSTSGFDELFADGALLTTELRVPTRFFDLPGHQSIGATWNGRTYRSLSEAYFDYPNVVIPTTTGSWSVFWNCDQYLVVDADDPSQGWGVFGRAGWGDDQTNPLAWFLSCGLGGSSPFRRRPLDTFGLGWYYAGSSNEIGDVLTTLFGPIGDGQGVECFYNYALTPAIRLTPDVQVIIPAQETIDPALIVGLRTQLIF